MIRWTIAALVIAGATAQAAFAAPILRVADNQTANAWTPPAACSAGTGLPPSAACVPAITTITGSPSGFRLNRVNTAPGAQTFTRASSFDNGVLTAGAESSGVENVVASSRFIETYNYVGPANTPYLVPFKIDRFSLGTSSSAVGDLQRARMLITIGITTNNVFTNVATLDWRGQSNGFGAFTLTPAPTPVAGVTLAPGFLAFAGVTSPNFATALNGPGGIMTVDLGSFAVGQSFKLDYRMSCRTVGTGAGNAFCNVGDPFAIPTGPGFDLLGLATPSGSAVPEPATWAMFVIGFGFGGGLLRARRSKAARIA